MEKHFLTNTWVLWFHASSNKNWDITSYKNLFEFETLENLIKLENSWNDCLPSKDKGMFFLMRKINTQFIYPIWEDKHNRNSGCWSIKIKKENINSVWKILTYLLIGETITINNNKCLINGISCSPKKTFCILKIWNSCKENKNILNLELLKDLLDIKSLIYRSHQDNITKDSRKKEKYKNFNKLKKIKKRF